MAPTIKAFLESGQKPFPPRRSVEVYVTRSRLALALERHLAGMSVPAKELMGKAGEFKRAPVRRLIYRAALVLPPATTARLIRTGKRCAPLPRRLLGALRRASGSQWAPPATGGR